MEAILPKPRGSASEDADGRSERPDEALDPFVVTLERVLAEDGLALRIVQLQIYPVHAIVLALQIGLTDELAAQARPRGLGRYVLGALDRVVVRDAIDEAATRQREVEALVGTDVVILQVHQRDL